MAKGSKEVSDQMLDLGRPTVWKLEQKDTESCGLWGLDNLQGRD
mgnify:FL=1